MIDEDKLKQRMQRIADLVRRLDTEADAGAARAQSRELLESVMDLHGEALERILQRLRGAGAASEELPDSLAAVSPGHARSDVRTSRPTYAV